MTNRDLEAIVLEDAVEDYTGLWELVDELQPGLADTRREEIATLVSQAVTRLIERGWIALYRGDRFAGEQVALSADDVASALAELKHWSEPEVGASHLRIGATDSGEQAYYNRPKQD